MILQGTKTATRRIWKKPMVKVDGIYKAKLKMLSKDFFTKIKVTKFFKQRLGDMTDEDARKEGYLNKMDFMDVWEQINNCKWDARQEVDVIEFKKIIEKTKNDTK